MHETMEIASQPKTYVIKRDGKEVDFDARKIIAAVNAANNDVESIHRLNPYQIHAIADMIIKKAENTNHALGVEDIQDAVEEGIMEMRGYEVARAYVRYRYKREMSRKANTTDDSILALLEQQNENIKQENSNKDPVINSTQRDYMAGEVSKDLTRRILVSDDVMEAHDKGKIHFHDADYFAQPAYNCCVFNLKDMLENGTVISNTKIDRPHRFNTACNIATQIIAQVASNQYGKNMFT